MNGESFVNIFFGSVLFTGSLYGLFMWVSTQPVLALSVFAGIFAVMVVGEKSKNE